MLQWPSWHPLEVQGYSWKVSWFPRLIELLTTHNQPEVTSFASNWCFSTWKESRDKGITPLSKPKCSCSKHTRGVWQKQAVKRCAECPQKRQPPHLLPSCKELRAPFNSFLYFEGVPNYFWPSWQQMSKEQVKKTNRKRVKGITASKQLAQGTALLSPHLCSSPTLRGMPGTSMLSSQHQAHQRGDQLLQDVLTASLGPSLGL